MLLFCPISLGMLALIFLEFYKEFNAFVYSVLTHFFFSFSIELFSFHEFFNFLILTYRVNPHCLIEHTEVCPFFFFVSIVIDFLLVCVVTCGENSMVCDRNLCSFVIEWYVSINICYANLVSCLLPSIFFCLVFVWMNSS